MKMADKVSDFIEKGLAILNKKKARYSINKREQQESRPETNAPITVISYRVFPEASVKNDSSDALARQFYYRRSLKATKIAFFLGGTLFSSVLATAIFATCFSVTTPSSRVEGNYCYVITKSNQLDLLTLDKVDFWDGPGNFTYGLFLSLKPPDLVNLFNCENYESERIKLTSDEQDREKALLARKLFTIPLGQAGRSNKSSLRANQTETHKEKIYPISKCAGFLPKYNLSVNAALNWILRMQYTMPNCLVNVIPLPETRSLTTSYSENDTSQESKESDSTESIS